SRCGRDDRAGAQSSGSFRHVSSLGPVRCTDRPGRTNALNTNPLLGDVRMRESYSRHIPTDLNSTSLCSWLSRQYDVQHIQAVEEPIVERARGHTLQQGLGRGGHEPVARPAPFRTPGGEGQRLSEAALMVSAEAAHFVQKN